MTKQQKALRAVALDRMGSKDEALSICRDLAHSHPTNETVLMTLMMVYKNHSDDPSFIDAIDMLEHAAKECPGCEFVKKSRKRQAFFEGGSVN